MEWCFVLLISLQRIRPGVCELDHGGFLGFFILERDDKGSA